MNAEELKALQAPIKDHYRKDPAAALITLRAEGRLGEGLACRVDTGKGLVEAGLHPATGGSGLQACSGDMLLEALVACAGVLSDARFTAEGDLDFRDIRLRFELDTDATPEQVKKLLELTERYCVVMQTIRNSVPVRVS